MLEKSGYHDPVIEQMHRDNHDQVIHWSCLNLSPWLRPVPCTPSVHEVGLIRIPYTMVCPIRSIDHLINQSFNHSIEWSKNTRHSSLPSFVEFAAVYCYCCCWANCYCHCWAICSPRMRTRRTPWQLVVVVRTNFSASRCSLLSRSFCLCHCSLYCRNSSCSWDCCCCHWCHGTFMLFLLFWCGRK